MIAALFVERGGVYWDLPGVDAWDKERDARLYAGPWPVVAHPPCERWGRYWNGGPSAKVRRELGDDDGCFASALASVRRWGGVLEHPAETRAFKFHGIPEPRAGHWQRTLDGDWLTEVNQAAYGHRARKRTWLLAHGVELPALNWSDARGSHRIGYFDHAAERLPQLPKQERAATPIPFRDLLLSIAASARQEEAA